MEYVFRTFTTWLHSGFVVMPEPGGWNDQPAAWCEDMQTCLGMLGDAERDMEDSHG